MGTIWVLVVSHLLCFKATIPKCYKTKHICAFSSERFENEASWKPPGRPVRLHERARSHTLAKEPHTEEASRGRGRSQIKKQICRPMVLYENVLGRYRPFHIAAHSISLRGKLIFHSRHDAHIYKSGKKKRNVAEAFNMLSFSVHV